MIRGGVEKNVTFFWNGKSLSAKSGDVLTVALLRNGVNAFAKTRKHHRPLGFSGCYTAGVLARVDGRPNVRLDVELVTEGMRVEKQNVWPARWLDILPLAQFIPAKWLRGGFEHGRLAPTTGRAFLAWERLLAWLAGVADPPSPELIAKPRTATRANLDLLVVGGGPAGIREANQAAARGEAVGLVTRGSAPARFARAMGISPEPLDPNVQFFGGFDLFGSYRNGTLLTGAPYQHDKGAILFQATEVVLATGQLSIPPMVAGSHIPGVMDARSAILMAAEAGLMPGAAIAIIGTGAQDAVADQLRKLGGNVVHVGQIEHVRNIQGRKRVRALVSNDGQKIPCDTVVHAGPWQSDHGLLFQARSDGEFQLEDRPNTGSFREAGNVAVPNEAIPVADNIDADHLVCPCMDVRAGEIITLIDAGETDPEVLKRLTSCGMGPCQGWPCWNSMIAILASRTGKNEADFCRPSSRAPRRALTLAQAAGLWDVVEVEK